MELGVNQKCICDFLSVINSNFGRQCTLNECFDWTLAYFVVIWCQRSYNLGLLLITLYLLSLVILS